MEAELIIEEIRKLYKRGYPDYDMQPIVLEDLEGIPRGRVAHGDSLIFCCRRGEREVQLTRAFVEEDYDEHQVRRFDRLTFVPFTLYHRRFSSLPIAFPPVRVEETLGEVVAQHGLRQVRIAESEKFNHVTFFFNGGRNKPFPGEKDIQIPTPKAVDFSEVPELSIGEVTKNAIESLRGNRYHLVVVNFANGDIMGHVDDREANLRCAQTLDKHLGLLLGAASTNGYTSVITADHGVFERMTKRDGTSSLSHTRNPVPLFLVGLDEPSRAIALREGGTLANIAPTVLEIMNLPKPKSMTHESLIQYEGKDGKGFSKGSRRKVLLIILDGCGVGRKDETNPLFVAHTPVLDDLIKNVPYTELAASGEAVGLMKGKNGNSESGHMNIAAGRIVLQDDVRIEQAIRDGSFYENEAFLLAIKNAKENNGSLHLLTMLSKGSSHGSMDYALELLQLAGRERLRRVFVHLIFDGRSTERGKTPALLSEFSKDMIDIGVGRIVTGMGRGYALDRDGNYLGKTKVAYDALVFGKGRKIRVPIRG